MIDRNLLAVFPAHCQRFFPDTVDIRLIDTIPGTLRTIHIVTISDLNTARTVQVSVLCTVTWNEFGPRPTP
jgi:hypothetical protein